MTLIKEFQKFISRGNVIDLAVGVIIGSAFGKIVTSLVEDIIMPPIGMVLGGINFTDFKFVLKGATENSKAITMNYGNFLQVAINFLIVAATIFVMVRVINELQKVKGEVPVVKAPPKEIALLTEIRDLLQKNQVRR